MIIKNMNELTVDNYWLAYDCIDEIKREYVKKNHNKIENIQEIFDFGLSNPSLCSCHNKTSKREKFHFVPYFSVYSLGSYCMHRHKEANPDYRCWKEKFCGINSLAF